MPKKRVSNDRDRSTRDRWAQRHRRDAKELGALLEAQALGAALMEHPLPWTVEEDWTFEVHDARGALVRKFATPSAAMVFICAANSLSLSGKKGP